MGAIQWGERSEGVSPPGVPLEEMVALPGTPVIKDGYLIPSDAPGFGIDISVIITFAATSVLMFVFVTGMAFKARRRPVVSGLEEMVGGTAVVVDDFEGTGTVTIHSEKWRALSNVPLHKDQQVKVTDIDGLTLSVEPIDASKEEEQS